VWYPIDAGVVHYVWYPSCVLPTENATPNDYSARPDDKLTYIYALHLTAGDYRYIGVTIDPIRRMRQHNGATERDSTLPVHNWMRKYPGEVQMTIIDTYDTYAEGLEGERNWIAIFRELYSGLLNLTDGGEGAVGYVHTEEAIAKMENRVISEETREKIRESRLGTRLSPEAIAKRTATRKANGVPGPMLGRHHTDETKAKMSIANSGRHHTEETKAKIGAANMGNTGRLGQPQSEETKEKIRIGNIGKNLGKTHTDEAKAKVSASLVGNKRAAGKVLSEEGRANLSIGNHVRWHVNRGIADSGCPHCVGGDVK
jgi:group I intron endonuclease